MQGRQAFDKLNNTLVYTQVWGPNTDTALWTNFDWQKAISTAMAKAGRPYSGEFGFVDTYMYWPTTHMVAPKEEAVKCRECHSEGGRLEEVEIPYMPAAGKTKQLDLISILAVLATLTGVLGHALFRWVATLTRKN
jgi:hypothetical protein